MKLLSELFTRFDQLCVQNKVYKVHTIGDCYVILGYNGHIQVHERTAEIKAEEAFRVIQTGFEMIDIISEVRNNSTNPTLKELNMRIGIHTGKIVAGIIGTKIVRYDIFGADVLIANKMESNGIPGEVVISSNTKAMLESELLFSEKLQFIHHKHVDLESVNREVDCYIVKHLQSSLGSQSSIRINNMGEIEDVDKDYSDSNYSSDGLEEEDKSEEKKTENQHK